jgi:hypothetical protein
MSTSQDQHVHRLLEEIENGRGVSQRLLSRRLGIALGLTNLLVRRVVRKGWVRIIHIRPNRVAYLITPAGLTEKAKMSRDYLAYSVRFYADARDRIRGRFQELSDTWPAGDGAGKRIVFFGAGEVAEIGYVCIHSTDLQLVGIVDADERRRFFGMDVHPASALRNRMLGDIPFDRLVVMSFGDRAHVEEQLTTLQYPSEDVTWI